MPTVISNYAPSHIWKATRLRKQNRWSRSWKCYPRHALETVSLLEFNQIYISKNWLKLLGALTYANSMMTDISMDYFKRFTVPALNNLFSKAVTGQHYSLPNQPELSMQALNSLMPFLMQPSNITPQNQPSQVYFKDFKFMFYNIYNHQCYVIEQWNFCFQLPQTNNFNLQPEMQFLPPRNGTHLSKVCLSRNSGSSSSVQSSLSGQNKHAPVRSFTNPYFSIDHNIWGAPDDTLEDANETAIFEPIRQRYDNDCNNLFFWVICYYYLTSTIRKP